MTGVKTRGILAFLLCFPWAHNLQLGLAFGTVLHPNWDDLLPQDSQQPPEVARQCLKVSQRTPRLRKSLSKDAKELLKSAPIDLRELLGSPTMLLRALRMRETFIQRLPGLTDNIFCSPSACQSIEILESWKLQFTKLGTAECAQRLNKKLEECRPPPTHPRFDQRQIHGRDQEDNDISSIISSSTTDFRIAGGTITGGPMYEN